MADYISTLDGSQMDSALLDMAEHNSEAWAVGERNGVAVSPDDVTYHNNAQYYAQQAQSIAPASVTEAVRWDVAQTALTDAQRTQGRDNINATAYNYNILDNSWFIVNLRGKTTYTDAAYTVDRWNNGLNTTVTVNANGVTVQNNDSSRRVFQQAVGNMAIVGQTCTISIKLQDGTIYSGTNTIPTSGQTDFLTFDGNTFRLTNQSTYIQVALLVAAGGSVAIRAIKLELGAISTLAYDTIPDYGEELTRCIYSTADTNDKYANQKYPTFSNENLLDNCFFVGGGSQLGYGTFPINQKGLTSYTGSGRMIDRWVAQNNAGTMTLTADGLVFSNSSTGYGYIRHTLTRATQKNGWTLSIIADGVLYTSSNSNGITLPSGLYLYWADSSAITIRIPSSLNASETISYIKYEASSISTALNDTKPDYREELLKAYSCYLNTQTDNTYRAYSNTNGTIISMQIDLPVPMRPITSVGGSISWIRDGANDRTATIPSTVNIQTPISVMINLSGTCTARNWIAVMGTFTLDTGI